MALIFHPTLRGWRAFTSSIFGRFRNLYVHCKDIKNISQFQIFVNKFLKKCLTLAYGVYARTREFADVSKAI